MSSIGSPTRPDSATSDPIPSTSSGHRYQYGDTENSDEDVKKNRSGVGPSATNEDDSKPFFKPGWSRLHKASSCAERLLVRKLLATGADPNVQDAEGRTPLDVAGCAVYYNQQLSETALIKVIRMLLQSGGTFNTMRGDGNGLDNVTTLLHLAVEMESQAIFQELLEAGASLSCVNEAGLTPLHVCVKKELTEFLKLSSTYSTMDLRDKDGHTVLRTAVDAGWLLGVQIAIHAGCDVTSRNNVGETPIHAAAVLGDLDILKEILTVAKHIEEIDCQNELGETALFKAILNGHADCVNEIINSGANIKIALPGEINVLHVAAENDQQKILKILLEHDGAKDLINKATDANKDKELYGFTPLHMAVTNNQTGCVEILLSKGADIKLKVTGLENQPTPLHIAAIINNVDMAKIILKFDKSTLNEPNGKGLLPLHAASKQGSREIVIYLIKEGADLSSYTIEAKKFRRTAIDMIVNNISKPKEFIEDIFDSYISSDGIDLQDYKCKVTVDYSVLIPTGRESEQLKVIEALLKTGNRLGQQELLVHPLLESFLYLKWKALLPFFYAIILIHSLFLLSFSCLIVSTFYYFDNNECPPLLLHPGLWCLLSVLFLGLKFFQDFHVSFTHRFKQGETILKLASVLFTSLTLLMIPWIPYSDRTRHIATIALLLLWLDMLFLISRFPNWGFYILMFGKVATNVFKILLTFLFLVIGFSFSFMILCRSDIPFDGPWPAIVKTIVMMTSEFDYGNLFDEEHSTKLASSILLLRIVFLVFVLVAAIALMNLLTGVAVNDISELELIGNIRRLSKQVAFISAFDKLVNNKVFNTILPVRIHEILKNTQMVDTVIKLRPRKYRPKHKLSTKLKDAIYNVAQKQQKETEDEYVLSLKKKINDVHKTIVNKNDSETSGVSNEKEDESEKETDTSKIEIGAVVTQINCLEDVVKGIQNETRSYIDESKSAIEDLKVKMDRISNEMMILLNRLESHLDK